MSFAGRGVHLLFRINSMILVCCLASVRLVYLQYPLICHGPDKINKIYAKSNVKKMASRIGQEIRLKQYPKGMPTKDIFELAKVDVPEPKEGELLVRNIWTLICVDG